MNRCFICGKENEILEDFQIGVRSVKLCPRCRIAQKRGKEKEGNWKDVNRPISYHGKK